MGALITTIHIIVCLILIISIILQSGKSADLAGAFGGVGSQTVFGPRGAASLLSKLTTICAVLFMLTSLGLWILSARGTKSILRGEDPVKKEIPAATETQRQQPGKKSEEALQKQEQLQEEQKREEKQKP